MTESMYYFNSTPLNEFTVADWTVQPTETVGTAIEMWKDPNSYSSNYTSFKIDYTGWDTLIQKSNKEISNFPKYPHIDCWLSDDGNTMFLQVALAGYQEKDIKANAVKNELFVTATRDKKKRKYVHQGISKKEIEFSIKVDENYSLDKSKTIFKDSLLTFEIPRSPDSPIVSLL